MDRCLLTPHAFTEEFARALATALPSATISVKGALELDIRVPAGFQGTGGLTNFYREYRLESGAFDEIVRRFAATLLQPEEAKLDPARIVPMIKDREWLLDINAGLKALRADEEQLSEPFNDELVIAYAEDRPTLLRYLTTKADTGVDPRELRALAVKNLRRILPEVMMQGTSSMVMMTAGGDFEASLLLLDEIWSGGQIKVDGDIVVAVPAREMLLVTGSRDRAGLEKLREMAARFAAESPYRLIDTLFIYRDGRFTKFVCD